MNTEPDQTSSHPPYRANPQRWPQLGQQVGTAGLFLYSAFAPHSIAAAEISLAIAGAGWLLRVVSSRQTGFLRTAFDFPILMFFLWSAASSFLSQEPQISIAKIQSTCVIFLFYLTQAIVTRRTAILLVAVMILSGVSGTVYSVVDIARGRGVVIESIAPDSPFYPLHIRPGHAIWRIGGQRMSSVADVDEYLRNSRSETVAISLIARGEHVELPQVIVTDAIKRNASPSGIVGRGPTHRFRASGWTRHYETYSEILQMLAQLSLGLALANFRNHGLNFRSKLAFAAAALLALGIAFTAMRTVLVALAIGFCTIGLRSGAAKSRAVSLAAILLALTTGVFVVYQARAQDALWFQDSSSSLRFQVARAGLARLMVHPVFGHGMDAMQRHWREWGFPGHDVVHLHSTPLQLTFDRGLPALLLWLWIMTLFWRMASRGDRSLRENLDTNRHGIMLGATGAVAGFFASSLVNYNFGDGEVALVFWWLLGIVVVLGGGTGARGQRSEVRSQRSEVRGQRSSSDVRSQKRGSRPLGRFDNQRPVEVTAMKQGVTGFLFDTDLSDF
ncbi:MAG: O-antigen ligase family protein [Pyrinomonadaceae bacterium]